MSEEEAEPFDGVAEAIQDNEPTTEPEEKPEEPKAKGGYQGYVDLSGLPDDIREPIEGRLAHMSSLMRTKEQKYNKEISEVMSLAEQQSKAIEELTSGFTGMADTLQEERFADAEERLNREINTAYENGDMTKYHEAHGKLTNLLLDKKLAERQKKEEPQKNAEVPLPRNAGQMANEAHADGDLSYEDQQYVNQWQDETDDSGGQLRPWAHNRSPDPNNPDPVYIAALTEANAIFNSPRFANATIEDKMKELDNRMGTPKRSANQNVMGGGLTRGRGNNKMTISPEAEQIAIKMKLGGPKAKSNADHIAAYRKQLKQIGAK